MIKMRGLSLNNKTICLSTISTKTVQSMFIISYDDDTIIKMFAFWATCFIYSKNLYLNVQEDEALISRVIIKIIAVAILNILSTV